MNAKRRTGATADHDACSRPRVCSPAADGSGAASAIARSRRSLARNRASLPPSAATGHPPANRMEWRSTGHLPREPHPGARGVGHARRTAPRAGAGAAGKEWVSWRGAIRRPGTPELRAAQPRLRERAPVATRSGRRHRGIRCEDPVAWRHGGIADAESGRSKTGPHCRRAVRTRMPGRVGRAG